MNLQTYFYYTLQHFCNRYNISDDYVLNILEQRNPLLTTANRELTVLLSEADLLTILGFDSFDDLVEDDPRKLTMIKILPI